MKTRSGFVSNSSSASFVLEIRKPRAEVEELLKRELPDIFDCSNSVQQVLEYYGYRVGTNEFSDYTISGWTVMWNDDSDMGSVLQSIVGLLNTKYRTTVPHRLLIYND